MYIKKYPIEYVCLAYQFWLLYSRTVFEVLYSVTTLMTGEAELWLAAASIQTFVIGCNLPVEFAVLVSWFLICYKKLFGIGYFPKW